MYVGTRHLVAARVAVNLAGGLVAEASVRASCSGGRRGPAVSSSARTPQFLSSHRGPVISLTISLPSARRWTAALMTLSLLVAAAPAAADDAQELFDKALVDLEAGLFGAACPAFLKSYRDPGEPQPSRL